jgi:hypothetical protein
MPNKGVSRKAELQRRQLPSTARATSSEPDGSRPLWRTFDIRISIVAKGTQTADVDGEIGDLRPPPKSRPRHEKNHATFRQWIGYASQTRKGLMALHGMIEALKRMFGG